MLEDVLNLTFARRLSADRRVAEDAIVERLLSLAGLFAGTVLAEGEAVVQVQMEMLKRSMLDAQCAQCRAVDLSCEVLQQQPGREPSSVTGAVGRVRRVPSDPIARLTRHRRCAAVLRRTETRRWTRCCLTDGRRCRPQIRRRIRPAVGLCGFRTQLWHCASEILLRCRGWIEAPCGRRKYIIWGRFSGVGSKQIGFFRGTY